MLILSGAESGKMMISLSENEIKVMEVWNDAGEYYNNTEHIKDIPDVIGRLYDEGLLTPIKWDHTGWIHVRPIITFRGLWVLYVNKLGII
jgi:hypothetical protein